MKLGYFTMPIHPATRNYTQTLKEDRQAILLADRLGYAEAFIGEHVTDICETIPSCLSFIASLAHDTRRIRLGSGTLNLPNSHPAQVAAHVSMID
ncbi:MAG: LLM class flavin-dependent oxidoreductase, partial [Burkholderiales bacterium]